MRVLYLTPCFHVHHYAPIRPDGVAEGQSHDGEFIGFCRRTTAGGCEVGAHEDGVWVACRCPEYGLVERVDEAGDAVRGGNKGGWGVVIFWDRYRGDVEERSVDWWVQEDEIGWR